MSDGSVYIIAEGPPAALDDFIRLVQARKDPVIRVEDLQVTECPATGEFKGFWVKW
jgi:acylphosphatase